MVEVVHKILACFGGIRNNLEDMKMDDEMFNDLNNDLMELAEQTQTVKKILVEYIQLVQSAIKVHAMLCLARFVFSVSG